MGKKGGRTTADTEAFRRAEEVLAMHEATLLRMPGVVAVGLGWTEQGNQPAIHVYMQATTHDGSAVAAMPQQIQNIPIRIIATDAIRAQ